MPDSSEFALTTRHPFAAAAQQFAKQDARGLCGRHGLIGEANRIDATGAPHGVHPRGPGDRMRPDPPRRA